MPSITSARDCTLNSRNNRNNTPNTSTSHKRVVGVDGCIGTLNYHRNKMNDERREGEDTPSLYAVTVTFNDFPTRNAYDGLGRMSVPYNMYDPTTVFPKINGYFHNFCKHTTNQCVPNNRAPRKRQHIPFFMSFIDLPRIHSRGGKITRGHLTKIPHIHSICLVPSVTVPKFESLVKDNFRISPTREKTKHIQTVYCEEKEWRYDEVKSLTWYDAKYLLGHESDWIDEEYSSLIFDVYGPTSW